MGAIYSAKDSYSIGFMLLSDLALAGCVYAYGRMRGIRPDGGDPTPEATKVTAGRP
jgi:NNP family nitrate/nitrite transporter-like MFS transporter